MHAVRRKAPHPVRRKARPNQQLPCRPSPAARRLVGDLVGGVDGELQEADDRVERPAKGRRLRPPMKETKFWIRVLATPLGEGFK
jgi:hypothetical protein